MQQSYVSPPPRMRPTTNSRLMSTCLYPFPTLFLPPLFSSKSIELLIGLDLEK